MIAGDAEFYLVPREVFLRLELKLALVGQMLEQSHKIMTKVAEVQQELLESGEQVKKAVELKKVELEHLADMWIRIGDLEKTMKGKA